MIIQEENQIDRRSREVTKPASYSGGIWFKSRLESSYPERDTSWHFSVPPGKWEDSTLHATTASFHILSNSLFTNHHII
jgi:hypothetical protein